MLLKENEIENFFRLKGRVIFFATNNFNKFNEARKVLSEFGLAVGMLRTKSFEIQSEDICEISRTSVIQAYKLTHLPIIVEDAGLFIEALNGFPGPYSAYVYKTIRNSGLLKLMKNFKNRTAVFNSAIAYYDNSLKNPLCFEGCSRGEITNKSIQGKKTAFGFDPIFKPHESGKAFSEMSILEKNKFSHRARALRIFGEWYTKK